MGAQALLIEETPWLGGMMTTAGVSALDGNDRIRCGIHREFVEALWDHYGGPEAVHTGWVSYTSFEPSVGQAILRGLVDAEPNITLWTETRIVEVFSEGNLVTGVRTDDGRIANAHVVIDATEWGDVIALAGAAHRIGREGRGETGETSAPLEPDSIVQDYTYCLTLRDFGPGEDRTIPEPPGYDPANYDGSIREVATDPDSAPHTWDSMISYGRLPNDLNMINWPIHGNDWFAPELLTQTPAQRQVTFQAMKNHSLGFLHYIQTVAGHPEFGIAEGEYSTPDGLPFYPYIRESRRLEATVMLQLQDVVNRSAQPDRPLHRAGVAVGDYFIDHHHTDAPPGYTGESFPSIPAVTVPLGCLIPVEVDGLLGAEKSIGVTHAVNGVTRLQPIVMNVGQAAGALAALAASEELPPREVSTRSVQQILLDSGSMLMPFADVAPERWSSQAIHRTSVSGVFWGFDQTRRTDFQPETSQSHQDAQLTLARALGLGTIDLTSVDLSAPGDLTRAGLAQAIHEIEGYPAPQSTSPHFSDVATGEAHFVAVQSFHEHGYDAGWISGGTFSPEDSVTREQLAVVIDRALDPFHAFPVDHVLPSPPGPDRLSARWLLHVDPSAEGRTGAPPPWFSPDTDLQRDMCANPVTGHLLITDRGAVTIRIVDSLTGADLGTLDSAGLGGGILPLAAVVTDAEGVIYACNYDQSAFRLYRWDSEAAAPTLAMETSLPEAAGRRIDLIGTGSDTVICVSRAGEAGGFHVLTTDDGETFSITESVDLGGGFSVYGVYGLSMESELALWLRGNALPLRRAVHIGGLWQEDTSFDPGLFNSGDTADLRGVTARDWFLALANDPGAADANGVVTQSAGGLIYEMESGQLIDLPAMAPMPRTQPNPNRAGAVDIDLSRQLVFVLMPRNGIGAYHLGPMPGDPHGLQVR
jgi:hypothetical protein